jgi:hypothetical protein
MANLQANSFKQPSFMRLGPFGGIDLSVSQSQISTNRSPDMLNFFIDERGSLNKRTGYKRSFIDSLGEGPITGMYLYRKINGDQYLLFTHNESLYMLDGETPVELYGGLKPGNRTSFFTINNICYILDGMNIKQFDGVSLTYPDQYIPTLAISKEPAGGGTAFEDFNLLGSGFKDSFSADGVAKDFFLSLKELDSTPVKADVNGVVINEGAGLTVDRTTGKVTFTTLPTKGTNNVIITAHKTYMEHLFFIRKCQFHTIYGGANDTRVFIGGNPDYPNRIWRSGLQDPTYFPENGFYTFPQRVKGFAKQYDYLLIELETAKYQLTFELSNGVPSFPSKPINDQVGTLATQSIQIIENNPVSLSKDGVHMLVGSNVRDERNVQHISGNVDASLLNETNLEHAISIDYGKKYWLGVNGRVYILDYTLKSDLNPFGEWYIFDNINAACFLEKDGELYFGSSTEGLIYKFKKDTDLLPYDDDGQPINAYWVSKLFDFDAPEYRKLIERIFVNFKPNNYTSVDVYTRTDLKGETFVLSSRLDKINFNTLDFNRFGFISSEIPQETPKKVKLKKINYLQLKLMNNRNDEGLCIFSLSIKYDLQNEVR